MSENKKWLDIVSETELHYQDLAAQNSSGPQIEGLLPSDTIQAQLAHSTVQLELGGDSVPLLVDNMYDSTANAPYYESTFPSGNVYRFMPVPLDDITLQAASVDLSALFEIAGDDPVKVIVMHEQSHDGSVEALARIADENGASLTEIPLFDTRNGTEAAVVHLTGLPQLDFEVREDAPGLHDAFYELVEAGKCELYPENGTTVLRPEVLTQEIKDHIWTIYNKQLDILIEQHPAYQRLTKEELEGFLEDDSSFNVVHVVDGKVATLFLGVTDLSSCPWLNKQKIEDTYDEDIVYCPAIVTDFEAQGHNYAKNIIALLTDTVKFRGKNIRPYFECTNISAEYIPKVIEDATIATGSGTLITKPVAKYLYRAFVLSR